MEEKIQNKLPDIERTVIIEASTQKVWDAISTSKGLASWLMPNDFKPEMEHEFTFRGEPKNGWDGVVYCKVKELNPPKRLGFTWCGNSLEQYVSFELIELGKAKTQFTLVHSGWTEENAMIRDIMYDGWGHITEDLSKKLGDKNGGYLS